MQNIRIVMVNPSHPGNIGAAARAMKTMGLNRLYLVAPRYFPHPDATAMAAGAEDILQAAIVVPDLLTAIKECQLVLGLSARQREIPLPSLDVREGVKQAAQCSGEIAFLFGRESNGLNNDELQRCHYQIQIPCGSEYTSLNVAAAMQILCYELLLAKKTEVNNDPMASNLASVEEIAGFYQHLEESLIEIGFLNPEQPKLLMQRLKALYQRAQLTTTEINLLRGILRAIKIK